MLENIEVLYHSSIRIKKEKIIYIDPFKVDKNYNDANIIFITHDHYDHYSEEDIDKVKNSDTIIIIPQKLLAKVLKSGYKQSNIITVEPNNYYTVADIEFKTVSAYNVNKQFHPKENGWVGYIIELYNNSYYIAGDTDIIPENKNITCDVAFIPVGGTYTMDFKEAASLTNIIKPKVVVPIHYGDIVGKKEDAINFSRLLCPEIECRILIK